MKNKFSLLIVGAFPPKNKNIYGGNVTDGELLLRFDFDKHFNLFIIDSTQISNPPPSFLVRLFYALKRIFNFSFKLFFSKQDVVLLFVADGVSVFEKGLMAWLAKFNRVPVFLFPGAGALITDVKKSKIYGFFVYIFMRGATNILCQGPGWQIFSTEFLKFNLLNTHIVYNWTATPELLEIGKKRIFYKSEKSLKILFLARLEKEKGIFELLKACQSLSYNFKFNLIIAGRGSAEAEAKDFVNKNQLNSYVEFIGWVHGPDKIKIFENSDILVLPSWNEGFPNVIIEAMAAKLTVITTSVGNIPDILINLDHCIIIPPRNVTILEQSLQKILIDNNFRKKLADSGYNFTKNNFSTEKCVKKLSDIIIRSLLTQNN